MESSSYCFLWFKKRYTNSGWLPGACAGTFEKGRKAPRFELRSSLSAKAQTRTRTYTKDFILAFGDFWQSLVKL